MTMDIAITTYPGHFFMTKLCLDSIRKFYEGRIHILLDDCEVTEWPTYVEDARRWYGDDVTYHLYSTLMAPYSDWIRSGWWRQQFVKLYMDTYVDSEDIFIVDGDVIFDRKMDIHIQPTFDSEINDIDQMCDNYVSFMLGTKGHLGDWSRTSQTPWRLVPRHVLPSLRQHVQKAHGKDFLDLHNDLIMSEDIAMTGANRMSMSEWELIEAYRTYVLDDAYPEHRWGGGWDIRTGRTDSFRHTSETDGVIGRDWLGRQLEISDGDWSNSQRWLTNRKW